MRIPPTLLEIQIKSSDPGGTFQKLSHWNLPVVPLSFRQFYITSFSERNQNEFEKICKEKEKY